MHQNLFFEVEDFLRMQIIETIKIWRCAKDKILCLFRFYPCSFFCLSIKNFRGWLFLDNEEPAKFCFTQTKNVLKHQRALGISVLTCLACLRAYLPVCLTCLHAHVPMCLTCLCARVPTCLSCSRANVPYAPTCSREKVPIVTRIHEREVSSVTWIHL